MGDNEEFTFDEVIKVPGLYVSVRYMREGETDIPWEGHYLLVGNYDQDTSLEDKVIGCLFLPKKDEEKGLAKHAQKIGGARHGIYKRVSNLNLRLVLNTDDINTEE